MAAQNEEFRYVVNTRIDASGRPLRHEDESGQFPGVTDQQRKALLRFGPVKRQLVVEKAAIRSWGEGVNLTEIIGVKLDQIRKQRGIVRLRRLQQYFA